MKVSDWMTRDPVTIRADDTLDLAQHKMEEGRFRRLPVLDRQGALVAILTDRDLRAHGGYLSSTLVNAAMTEKPLSIGPDEPIERAADLMLERKFGGLPVVTKDGHLIGILTQTDLLRGLMHGRTKERNAGS